MSCHSLHLKLHSTGSQYQIALTSYYMSLCWLQLSCGWSSSLSVFPPKKYHGWKRGFQILARLGTSFSNVLLYQDICFHEIVDLFQNTALFQKVLLQHGIPSPWLWYFLCPSLDLDYRTHLELLSQLGSTHVHCTVIIKLSAGTNAMVGLCGGEPYQWIHF